jgi:hypothetical protein
MISLFIDIITEFSDVDSDEDSESEYDECEELTLEEENVEWCNPDRATDARLHILVMFLCKIFIESNPTRTKKKFVKKTIEDRLKPWMFIQTWSDNIFRRQFRMSRSRYYLLMRKIVNIYPGPYAQGAKNYSYSCQQGDNSRGSHFPLEIKLCVTLRLLAGASYLDMIWY